MAKNLGLYKCLSLAASISGLIQGIVWSILALVAILYYRKEIVLPDLDVTSYNQLLHYYTYFIYLNPDATHSEINIVNQEVFYIFSWIYFWLSIFWFVASGILFLVLFRRKWKLLHYIFITWSSLTLLISLLDLIFFSLLTHDYVKFLEFFSEASTDSVQAYVFFVLICGAMMTFAIRGYVLWIFNVVIATLILIFGIKISKRGLNERNKVARDRSPISAYASNQQPFWITRQSTDNTDPWFPDARNSGAVNSGFESQEPSTPSFLRTRSETALHDNRRSEVNPYYARSLGRDEAKIQRPTLTGSTTSGRHRQMDPAIPEPDYTPPVSPTAFRKPMLKSVLKNRSQYA